MKNIIDYIFNLKRIVFLFFIVSFFCIAYNLYFKNISGDGFILGDWLVNYEDGGFKRRGLSGSIFFLIQDITGMDLGLIVYLTQMSLYLTFFLLLFRILIKKQITLIYCTLLISPLLFIQYIEEPGFTGRKEIILFNIFALYLYFIIENKLTPFKENLIYALLVIATLFHEITIFYIPYFILAHYLIYKKPNIKKYLLFFSSCFIPALLIFLLGAKTNEGESLNILASRGIELTEFSIFSFSNGLLQDIHLYKEKPIGYSLYFLSLLLGIWHVSFYIKKETTLNHKKILTYFIVLIIYSLPLFVMVCDWGRWIQIHFILLFLILTFKLKDINNKETWESSRFIFSKTNFRYLTMIPFLFFWQVRLFDLGFYFRGFSRILALFN